MIISTIRKYGIFIPIGMFCLLYYPPLFRINVMHIVGLLSWLYLFMKGDIAWSIIRQINIAQQVFAFADIFVYSLFVCLVNSTSYLKSSFPIYYIVDVIPFGLSIAIYSKKRDLQVGDFFDMVLFVGEMQALCSILAIFVPEVQSYFAKRLLDYGYDEVYSNLTSYRIYGFAGNMTFSMPLLQSLLSILAVYFAMNRSAKYALAGFFLAFSAIINARVSLFVFSVGIVILILSNKLIIKKRLRLLILSVLSLYFIVRALVPSLLERFPITFRYILSGVDEIGRFLVGDTAYGYFSYLTDKNNYRIPESIRTILFGTGHITMGMLSKYGFSSDVGYINDLWFGGIFYILIVYVLFIAMMWRLYRSRDKTASLLGLYFLLIYPIVNFKGIVFSMNSISNFVVIAYIYIMAIEKTKKREDSREV